MWNQFLKDFYKFSQGQNVIAKNHYLVVVSLGSVKFNNKKTQREQQCNSNPE